jgi:protein-tyrosine phosphatase
MKTDFHSHILPSVDDGAENISTSLKMIEELTENGISSIVLTPHFYPHKISLEKFLINRKAAYEKLMQELKNDNKDTVNFILASETYLNDFIFNYEDISGLCLNGGKYLLTELPYNSDMTTSVYNSIQRLINNFNVIPILAHIDRYPFLMKNPENLIDLMDMGCLCQMNIFSLCSFSLRKKLLDYIKNDYIHFLGTDFHKPPFETVNFKRALNFISKKIGDEYINILDKNTKNLHL